MEKLMIVTRHLLRFINSQCEFSCKMSEVFPEGDYIRWISNRFSGTGFNFWTIFEWIWLDDRKSVNIRNFIPNNQIFRKIWNCQTMTGQAIRHEKFWWEIYERNIRFWILSCGLSDKCLISLPSINGQNIMREKLSCNTVITVHYVV